MKEKFDSIKNHVYTYRARYAVAGTLTACVAAQICIAKEWNEFLEDHDLVDMYYHMDEE